MALSWKNSDSKKRVTTTSLLKRRITSDIEITYRKGKNHTWNQIIEGEETGNVNIGRSLLYEELSRYGDLEEQVGRPIPRLDLRLIPLYCRHYFEVFVSHL